jgi:hypothetical protein
MYNSELIPVNSRVFGCKANVVRSNRGDESASSPSHQAVAAVFREIKHTNLRREKGSVHLRLVSGRRVPPKDAISFVTAIVQQLSRRDGIGGFAGSQQRYATPKDGFLNSFGLR